MTQRAQAARRCRQVVLTGLALFALSQLTLCRIADTRHPELRDPAFGARLVRLRARIQERPGRPLVLALGSSRVENGVKPDELGLPDDGPIVFNFGQPGAGPLLQRLTLQRLWVDGIRPDRLLVEVMPALLTECRTVADDLRAERMTAAELVALAPNHPEPSSLWRRWLEGRLAPIHTWRFALLSRQALALLPWSSRLDYLWQGLDGHGFMALRPDFFNPEARPKALQKALAHHELLQKYTITPLADRALRQLLENCRREQTEVLLVLMPEGDLYRGMYPPAALAQVEAYLAGLRRDYGVTVIDARTWVAEEGFFDSHHLLPAGASAFSRRFGREACAFLFGNNTGG